MNDYPYYLIVTVGLCALATVIALVAVIITLNESPITKNKEDRRHMVCDTV